MASYVLNTRPVLNFLGIGRVGLLRVLLGDEAYVPPTVVREVAMHAAWTVRDLQRRSVRGEEPVSVDEIEYAGRLRRWDDELRPPRVRRIRQLAYQELSASAEIMTLGSLDPGESEVLAVAQQRGWVAVIDEFSGHCVAEAAGVANQSTLGALVEAVRGGTLALPDAEAVWSHVQGWWDYAPRGALTEYVDGRRDVWPPC